MELKLRHWLLALVIALIAHAALAVILTREPTQPAARSHGFTLELGLGGGETAFVGDGELAGKASVQPAIASEPESKPRPEAEPDVKPEHESALAPEPAVEPEPALKPELASEPMPELEPETETTPDPAPKPVSEIEPEPELEPEPEPKTVKPSSQARAEVLGSSGQTTLGMDRGAAKDSGGPARQSAAGGNHQGAGLSDYQGQLAAWLNRHKRYPRMAQRMRQEGTTRIRFTIDREGRLIDSQLLGSSGHKLLDQESLAMLERATPMPPIPDQLASDSLTISLPVNFSLR